MAIGVLYTGPTSFVCVCVCVCVCVGVGGGGGVADVFRPNIFSGAPARAPSYSARKEVPLYRMSQKKTQSDFPHQ